MAEKNQIITIATGLADTVHSLVLCKLTGVECGCLVFQGLTLDSLKTLVLPPAMPDLCMETYGTSIASGVYASCVGSNNCVSDQSKDNGYIAYPSIVARRLNAAMFNNGISGLALNTGYGYFQSTTGLDTTWNKLCPNTGNNSKKTLWKFSRFTPKLVIMGMGINDQTTWPSSGATRTTAINNFISTYIGIAKKLDSIYSHPAFLFCVDPMGGTTGASYTASKQVSDSLRKMGLKTWYYQYTNSYGWVHPDSAQTAKMGNELADYIKAQHIIDSVQTGIRGLNKVAGSNSMTDLRIVSSAGASRLMMTTSEAGRMAINIFDLMGRRMLSLDQWYDSGYHVVVLPRWITTTMLIVEIRSNAGVITRTLLPVK